MICIVEEIIKNNIINNKFSYSKINTFDSCPQKFKINYIDKVKNNNESIEAFMGKRVHEVLDWLYKESHNIGDYVTLDVLYF